MTSCQEKTYRKSPQIYLIFSEIISKEPHGISPTLTTMTMIYVIGYRQVNAVSSNVHQHGLMIALFQHSIIVE